MSPSPSVYPWAPPLFSDVDFSDCGEDMVMVWKYYVKGNSQHVEIADDQIYPAILHALRGYLQANGFEQPNQSQVLRWESETHFISIALQDTFMLDGACKKEICPLLGWEGNADIAGRGMLVAYIIQATLITIYIPTLLTARFDWLPAPLHTIPMIGRTVSAVQHSTAPFLNASIVFSIAMLSGSLISFAKHDISTVSTLAIMSMLPFSSILPVALLQLAASNMLRRNRGRLFSWILMAVLMISILITAHVIDTNNLADVERHSGQIVWETHCLNKSYVVHILWFSRILAGLLILGVGCFIVSSFSTSLQLQSTLFWSNRLAGRVWWTALVAAFLIMWLCLSWLIHFQNKRNEMAGDDNKDTEWSFGQILAVATWVPVIVEFIYIWWEKPVKALHGRLMDPYEVKEVSKDTTGFEVT